MAKKFIKNLKSLFIVEEEDTTDLNPLDKSIPKRKPTRIPPKDNTPNKIVKTPDETSKKPPVNLPSDLPVVPPPQSRPKPPARKINPKIADILLKAMQDGNLEGFDYLEFKESLEKLTSITADEETRYKTAYAVVSSMGTNVHKLIESARHYVTILAREKERFGKEVLKKMERELGAKKKSIVGLDQSIKDKKAEIEKLKKDIDSIQRQMIEEIAQVDQDSGKVKEVETDFNFTYSFIKGKIDKDIRNMREYLTVKAENPLEDDLDFDLN